MRARDLLFRAGLAVPIGAAAILCAELGIRLLASPPAQLIAHDPELGWRIVAHARISYREGPLTTNAHGFRGPEHAKKASPTLDRILLLGDSYTAGMHFPDETIFPSLLSKKLGAEVLSAAVPAWATDQQLLFFEREGARLDANLVLLVVAPNDIRESYARATAPVGAAHLSFPDRLTLWLMNRSSIAQWLGGRLGFLDAFSILRRYYRFTFPLGGRDASDHDLFLRDEPTEARAARAHFEGLVRRLHERCRQAGARLAVTVMPTLLEQSFPLITSKAHQPGLVAERVRAFLRQEGIAYVDLATPALALAGESRALYMENDFHLSPRGHSFIAQHLATALPLLLRHKFPK